MRILQLPGGPSVILWKTVTSVVEFLYRITEYLYGTSKLLTGDLEAFCFYASVRLL